MSDTKGIEKVVIIGSGPAGWTAAIYAARANLNPVCVIGVPASNPAPVLPGGQLMLTTEVENYPGFPDGVTGPEMMERFQKQAERFGTKVISDDVVRCDFSSRPATLHLGDGSVIRAHAVIIATGATANWLGLPNELRLAQTGGGVSACAVCDGALPRFRNKPIVVVGGGDSAVEEATYLSKFASRVHLVHRRDALRASKIMAQRAFDNPKIEVHFNTALAEVLGDDQQGVTGVRLAVSGGSTGEKTLDAAGVFLAIGHTPNTAFLDGQLELTPKKYIVWKRHFRTATSVDGVFAAGDVADDYYRQAISAAGTGCMSALDAERWLAHADGH
jgi:thioredoxin reductase (NADPH)